MQVSVGRALWKPYESEFGRELRTLASNPALCQTQYGRRQLNVVDNFKRYPQPGHRIPDTELEAYNATVASRWPLFSHSNKGKPTSICSRCAEIGYHSWLFELSWLERCPVHRIPLCVPYECVPITHNIIGFGGTKSRYYENIEALREALFNPIPYFRALTPLAQFCHCDDAIIPVNLFNPLEGDHALLHHESLFACNKLYPSIILALFPNKSSLISGQDLHLRKLVKVEIPCHPAPDLTDFFLTHLHIRCHFIRERVRKRILRLIKTRTGKVLEEPDIQKEQVYDYFYENMNLEEIAYKSWLSIVDYSTNTSTRPQNFSAERLYYQTFGCQVPLIPTPMVGFIEGKFLTNRYPTFFNSSNVLPLSLTLLIYEIDCWCLFRSILMYLVAAKYHLNTSPNGRLRAVELKALIPLWAQPNAGYSEDIVTYLINDHFISLFPYTYIDPDCSDITFEGLGHGD